MMALRNSNYNKIQAQPTKNGSNRELLKSEDY